MDDEEGFLELMKMALEDKEEFEVFTETRGENGVCVARKFKPDLILLDIIMPDVGGYEVLRRLKGEESLKDIPVIFLSVYAGKEEIISKDVMIKECLFMAKPVSIEKLISCIKNKIGGD